MRRAVERRDSVKSVGVPEPHDSRSSRSAATGARVYANGVNLLCATLMQHQFNRLGGVWTAGELCPFMGLPTAGWR